jgi:hypothetical protein
MFVSGQVACSVLGEGRGLLLPAAGRLDEFGIAPAFAYADRAQQKWY